VFYAFVSFFLKEGSLEGFIWGMEGICDREEQSPPPHDSQDIHSWVQAIVSNT